MVYVITEVRAMTNVLFFFLSMEKFIEKYVNVLLKRKTYDHKVLPLSILSCHCC